MGRSKRVFKRKYEQRLIKRAIGGKENREFLLGCLKKEWEEVEKIIERDKRKRKLYDTIKETGTVLGLTILGMAAVCGVLFIGAVAPNVFSVFGRFGRHRRYFDRREFRERASYLRRRGYIDILEDSESADPKIKLTELGQEQVARRTLKNLKIIVPEKWDGIWRVVIFDVPEQKRWSRDGLRDSLKRLGFYRIQKSTFVFPYPCREEIGFLRRLYDANDRVRFIETSSLDFDYDLKEFFGLKGHK